MKRILIAIAALAASIITGCSGGGKSSVPAPVPTLGGAGSAAAFNQKITFTIEVPGTGTSTTARQRRAVPLGNAAAASPTPTPTTPYVSPMTGSVVLTIAEINSVSPQQAPPLIAPINIPASCQGTTTGCTVPAANVPAAIGVDRYFVQTYTGQNGKGTIISTGFVDVTVPVKPNANPAIGGTAALSIGGFVANIILAPKELSFVQGVASDQPIIAEGIDAAGATIIGAAQFVTPITVSLNGDTTNFTLNGSASPLPLAGPLTVPITLHYTGGASFGTFVQATSQNGSGVTVSATPITAEILLPGSSPTPPPLVSLPAPTPVPTPTPVGATPTPVGATATPTPVGATPTPAPTPTPTPVPTAIPTKPPTPVPTAKPSPTAVPTQALSLYVADAASDTISEYRIASQIEAGQHPNPAATPSRVIKFAPSLVKSSIVASTGLSCNSFLFDSSGNQLGHGTGGVSIDPKSGTIYVLPACTDGQNSFVFGYPANAVGEVAPTIVDAFPQVGISPSGLAINTVAGRSLLYVGYTNNGDNAFYEYTLPANGQQPSAAIGQNCFAEFGYPNGSGCFYTGQSGFGVDNINGTNDIFMPAEWYDTAPVGDVASALSAPAALLVVPGSSGAATVNPFSAISGINSSVGGAEVPPAATVDSASSIAYVLAGAFPLNSADGTVQYFPGLSDCPPPSNNPTVNQVVSDAQTGTQCADGQQHLYLATYSIGLQLLGIQSHGKDVALVPNVILGGDVVGKFGCEDSPLTGQLLAASQGFVYVINEAPTCPGESAVFAPEIDVYNTNNLTGAFTNQAPVFVLPLNSSYPLAVAIGPSGTVTGGQSLLATKDRTYRPGLFGRRRATYHLLHRKPR